MSGTNGLKSAKLHPYMKVKIPFWRHIEPGSLMGYSSETVGYFESRKIDFDNACKYYSWQTKPVKQ